MTEPARNESLFDAQSLPLARQQLIEASAGTGKTYSIAGLFLRLVLEKPLPVDRILVVTYTNAATAELRERIRSRLSGLRDALRADGEIGGPDATLLSSAGDRDAALRRLEAAVLGFDTAAVHTIHGFCQRALAEHAFASGVAFDRALVPDPSERLRSVVQDCWRREVYEAEPGFVRWLLARNESPEAWIGFLREYVAKPYLEIRKPRAETGEGAEAALREAMADVTTHFERTLVLDLLLGGALNASSYKAPQLEVLCDQVQAWIDTGEPPTSLPKNFDRFTPAKIESAKKKGQSPPQHPFFDACEVLTQRVEALDEAFSHRLAHLRDRLLWSARDALAEAKQERREYAYDDLLLDLQAALRGPGGERLAGALRERYPAAMVDEFQDTDPVQYDILRRIYGGSDAPLFLVGDPKQAIYRFRGADVFAYIQGGEEASGRHTLAHNWRSLPRLVEGVNALFGRRADAFVLEGIRFKPARAAAKVHRQLIVAGEAEAPPLRLWTTPAGADPLTKGDASELAARATAAEIARLLSAAARGEARLDEQPLGGGDVAVLVPTHRQGTLVRERLRALGVGSVQLSGESVFSTREAEQLGRLLAAIAEPARESLLRAALLTDLLGGDAALLHRLREEDSLLQDWLERFAGWHREWQERGLLPALRIAFEQERVSARLLALVDGERRLTNTLHLAELLQQGPVTAGVGPAGTLKWLQARIERAASGGRAEDEIQELRLESDENLVNIVTVHRSKGLQYPVVFCPFLWDSRTPDPKAQWVDWHDPRVGRRHVLDLGSEDLAEAREGARLEALAESLRLAYVALTRAEQRCYVTAPDCKGFAASALGWLLGGEGAASPLRDRLLSLAAEQPDALCVTEPPETANALVCAGSAGAGLQARTAAGSVRSHRVIGSFSSLSRGQAADRPDHDAGVVAPLLAEEPRSEPSGIFAFPRGARAGTCLHAVFEDLDFPAAAGGTSLQPAVTQALRAHGFDPSWSEVVTGMVQKVLATALTPSAGPRLADVPPAACLHELEFYYPVQQLTAADLSALMSRHGLPPLAVDDGSGFAPLAGYLKGYVDLVFEAGERWYVLDWKSNWLGASLDDYLAPRLEQAMSREGYHLQYLVYVLALHRWLRLRLPGYDYERHFGGVFYLFLRGMEPKRGSEAGVYATRPARALVEELDALVRDGRVSS